jgi:thiol-disulfide isomerase/thioredoxin
LSNFNLKQQEVGEKLSQCLTLQPLIQKKTVSIVNLKNIKMMKQLLLLIIMVLIFGSCIEAPIEIPKIITGKKVVLVEELTGVRCPSCPAATIELTRLSGLYGKNLIVVANHSSGNFSTPMTNPPNAYDFRGQDFKDMAAFIGTSIGYPAASINRLVHGSEPSAFTESTSSWGAYIVSELSKDPYMDLFAISDYNQDSRELKATVRILPTSDVNDPLHLTVMITQDSIIDAQTVGPQKVPDYTHRHVLRKLLTKSDGDPINEAFAVGGLIERTYYFTLPNDFVSKHCSIVAAVHRTGTPDKAVLQAAEVHVED